MAGWERFARRRAKYCRLGEALCAVCLTKRLAGQYFEKKYPEIKFLSFPSTSEVATSDFKLEIAAKGAAKKYGEFVNAVNALQDANGQLEVTINPVPKLENTLESWNIDGDWLFEESFSEHNLDRDYGISKQAQEEQRTEICQCTTLRKELIRDANGLEPSRYFAVIVLDGDGMGQTISQAESWETHSTISQKLNEYTKKVRKIVDEDNLGKLIYAGGDDVLALANLHDLLNILHQLKCKFPNLNSDDKTRSTVSAGVCIAHYKIPLGDVMKYARTMEQAAKSVDGKNALGIALLKHSGNISRTVFKWKYEDEDAGSLDTINVGKNLLNLIRDGEVSKKFIYTFRESFSRLCERDGTLELPYIVESELKRLIRRATSKSARSDSKIQDRIENNVQELSALLTNTRMKFSDFVGFLEIVNFIARGGRRDETVLETE